MHWANGVLKELATVPFLLRVSKLRGVVVRPLLVSIMTVAWLFVFLNPLSKTIDATDIHFGGAALVEVTGTVRSTYSKWPNDILIERDNGRF